ncbi:MAG: DUF973 family protein [Methanomassiliicoccales archaeon]|jgi:hypothetical protein|nr:DUF973 family protein [Methanomassiliicoccales archaeon]
MKQELDNLNMPFMAKSAGPPWLPAPAVESREIAWWTQWVLALFGLLLIVSGIISFFTLSWFWAGYSLVSGIVYFLLLFLMKSTFFDTLDQGKFKEASDKLIIWVIVGIIFGFVPGLLLLIAYIRLRDVFQPNYQPYPAGTYQAGPAPPQQQQQYSAPPPQQAPPPQPPPQQAPPPQPASQEQQKHADMVKCKKCGVQFPAFMRTCPNCNEPR